MGERITFVLVLLACLALAGLGLGSRWQAPSSLQPLHQELRAQVVGAVVTPGAYTLPWGSRVEDLIEVAGGLLPAADRSLLAWSTPLTDGARWVVATRGDPAGERIDVNGASALLLASLPGIGPVMAERIIRGRPYHRLEDLLRVSGIGEARLTALQPLVSLGPP